jgi:hypothetical protein
VLSSPAFVIFMFCVYQRCTPKVITRIYMCYGIIISSMVAKVFRAEDVTGWAG